MKRLIAIPLLFLYLVAISGAMVQIHYCGDEVTSWTVNNNSEKGCCCESNEVTTVSSDFSNIKASDCCSDKTFTLKVNEVQNSIATTADFLISLAEGAVVLPEAPTFLFAFAAQVKPAHTTNAPPGLWQDIPLYKLHSSFTYYG
jgi:hypothetical protein